MAESRAMDADRVNISAPIPAALRRAAVGAAILPAGETPEWIELIPAGEFAGRDGRGPYRLTDAAAVIEASQALRMDAGLPIDYDHATDFAAPAARGRASAHANRSGDLRAPRNRSARLRPAQGRRFARSLRPRARLRIRISNHAGRAACGRRNTG